MKHKTKYALLVGIISAMLACTACGSIETDDSDKSAKESVTSSKKMKIARLISLRMKRKTKQQNLKQTTLVPPKTNQIRQRSPQLRLQRVERKILPPAVPQLLTLHLRIIMLRL